MRVVEAVGATVDEAIERALRELQVERGAVDVEELTDADRIRVRVRVRAEVSPETPAQIARRVLDETLRMLGFSCTIAERPGEEPGSIVLDVSGDDEGAVIGRHGQTLDALDHLLNRIAFRDDYGAGRIVVDVAGYRKRREQSLEEMAHRLAERARDTGRPVVLDPMSARDRRIVHLVLSADATVTTRSEGEGQFRRLVIVPQPASGRRS